MAEAKKGRPKKPAPVPVKVRAEAIYRELLKARQGVAPPDRLVQERLAAEGHSRTISMIAKWRKDGGWAPAVAADTAKAPILMTYGLPADCFTTVEIERCAAKGLNIDRLLCAGIEQALGAVDWRGLGLDDVLKAIAARTANLQATMSQQAVLAMRRGGAGYDRSYEGPVIENDDLALPPASEAQIERSRVAREQAQKVLEGFKQ
jgi:hypothetical protein